MAFLLLDIYWVLQLLALLTLDVVISKDFVISKTIKYDTTQTTSTLDRQVIYDMSSRVHTGQKFIFDEMFPGIKPEASFTFYYGSDFDAATNQYHPDVYPFSFILNEKAIGRTTTEYFVTSHIQLNKEQFKDPSIDAVIIGTKTTVSSNCSANVALVLDSIQEWSNMVDHTVKLGIEYDEAFFECPDMADIRFPKNLKYFVLRVQIRPIASMLTYGNFSESIETLISNSRKFIQKYTPDGELVLRLMINHTYDSYDYYHQDEALNMNHNLSWSTQDETDPFRSRYEALVTSYMQTWNKRRTGNEKIIINFSGNNVVIPGTNEYFRNRVGVIIEKEDVCNALVQMSSIQKNSLLFVKKSNSNNKIHTVPRPLHQNEVLAECLLMSSKFLNGTKVNLVFQEIEINSILESVPNLNMALDVISTVYFRLESSNTQKKSLNGSSQWLTVYDHLKSKNTKVGCYPSSQYTFDEFLSESVASYLNNIVDKCYPVFNHSAEILQDFVTNRYSSFDILALLTRFQLTKQHFEIMYPDKILIPVIKWNREFCDVGGDLVPSYCNLNRFRLENKYLQITVYANIHNWTHFYIIHDSCQERLLGVWNIMEIGAEIHYDKTKLMVLYRSNLEETEDSPLPFTYPCIKFTDKVKIEGINFLTNKYTGTTVDINLRNKSLAWNELQTSLLFSLERFSFIEVIAANTLDIQVIERTLSPWLFNSMHQIRPKNAEYIMSPLIYIEIPIRDFLALREQVISLKERFGSKIAVHVTGWEMYFRNNSINQKDLSSLEKIGKYEHVGVTIQNCSQEVNQKLERLFKLPFIHKVGYVVCDADSLSPYDQKYAYWMQVHFGNMFYAKTYIEKIFRESNLAKEGFEAIFRINVDSTKNKCGRTDTESNLRFLNDYNQFSAAYQIKFFIVRAFEGENMTKNCAHTWWRIKYYTDLANPNNYVDREHAYLQQDTKLITQLLPDQTKKEMGYAVDQNIVYYIMTPVIVLALVSVLFLWLHLQRIKKRLLTQQEVAEFYDGIKLPGNNIAMTGVNLVETMYMKFQKSYELPSTDIEIGTLIGCGQFGVVHKGLLRSEQEVAIKIPRSDSGVEQFKSTLSELKMHCYIGTHPNVVCLLGACTKQIAVGKLFIVTEFCENGSLHGHLLKIQKEKTGLGKDYDIDVSELCSFALQIARGMQYVSEKRVIHGDLATRNVLLTCDNTCKIADFGLSRRLYELSEYKKTSKEPLPWRWLAPESLINLVFTTKSDVWSYGVTLWEIFSFGRVPYPGKSWNQEFVTELENGMRMQKANFATDEM